jgi:hypothetical protein
LANACCFCDAKIVSLGDNSSLILGAVYFGRY